MINLIIFLLVLSFLIFFHELGHFLAAKACNIYVDRFSIGMPPRAFGIKWGETDYCIGALPIGGFVKMAGQEDAPMSEEERTKEYGEVPPERWFNNKPVWQRVIVIVAGPFMNVVVAVVLYGVIAAVGADVPEWEVNARIGKVESGAPAASAPMWRLDGDDVQNYNRVDFQREPDSLGWKTGDLIVLLGGRSVDNISDLAIEAVLGGEDRVHDVVLQRLQPDGSFAYYVSRVSPRLLDEGEYPRFGVAPFSTALIGDVMEDMPAASLALQAGDIIQRANGELVDATTFREMTEQIPEGDEMLLEILRDDEQFEVALVPETIGRIQGLSVIPKESNIEASPLEVAMIGSDLQEQTGLQRRDVIVEVNGIPATIETFRDLERAHPDENLLIKVQRPAIMMGILQSRDELELVLPVDAVRAVGIGMVTKTVYHRTPASQVIPEAFRQSYLAVSRTLLTLKALIFQDVSIKDLGGPVMIYTVTTQAAEAGWLWLTRITAFISINLAIFNMLPIPVLDGGLLVLNTLEAIRRKPLNPKFQERYQALGLLLIVSLMVFVTWQDIVRLISNSMP